MLNASHRKFYKQQIKTNKGRFINHQRARQYLLMPGEKSVRFLFCLLVVFSVLVFLPYGPCPVLAADAIAVPSHPRLKVGDQWLEQVTVNERTYRINYQVTGDRIVDAVPCYALKATFDPAMMSVYDKGSILLDKEMFMPKVMLLWNSRMKAAMNIEFKYQYEFKPEPLYPLSVGKEVFATEIKSTVISMSEDKSKMDESREIKFVVETKETVTVPAGSFQCFKVVEYDKIGMAIRTFWMAYETKYFEVKAVNHESGELTELLSYHVSF
ncbi:MAG: hypothetical protein K8S27_04145 [Candidatus Omnitrophica bacterium]|nr:hypothetical protein [Candidatus Omnitrophota bacterium]